MDIVFLTVHPANKGGIANWVRIIQKKLPEFHDINPTYIYPADLHDHEKPAIERSFFERLFRGSFLMLRAEFQLIKVLKRSRGSLVHLTSNGGLSTIRDLLYVNTARLFKCPIIYHIRFGRIPEIADKNTSEWKRIKRIIKKTAAVIAIDKKTFNTVKTITQNTNVFEIPNLIDFEENVFFNQEGKNEPTVLFVGWVVKTKGVEELLRAWNRVRSKFPNYYLKLIGPITDEYKQYLSINYPLVHIELCGGKDHEETMEELSKAEVFILPSYTEGFPNSILEAMAYGKAIIGSDVGAIPEMIKDCGIIVKKGSVEGIEAALVRILDDEGYRTILGNKAKARMKTVYAADVVMRQYYDLWESISTRSKNRK